EPAYWQAASDAPSELIPQRQLSGGRKRATWDGAWKSTSSASYAPRLGRSFGGAASVIDERPPPRRRTDPARETALSSTVLAPSPPRRGPAPERRVSASASTPRAPARCRDPPPASRAGCRGRRRRRSLPSRCAPRG